MNYFNKNIILILATAIGLTGCDYRQAQEYALEESLSHHYQFRQKPGTLTTPPAFYVCDGCIYSCVPISPIYSTSASPIPKVKHKTKLFKKHNSKKRRESILKSVPLQPLYQCTRIPPCKISS